MYDDEMRNTWLVKALAEVYGEIIAMQEECPGVYYVSARRDEAELLGREYYIMDKRSPSLSDKAKAYGQQVDGLPGFLSCSMNEIGSGQKVIAYEILRYRTRNHIPSDDSGETLREFARYAAEYHPEYFGTYPAPLRTPRGAMTRYQTVDNGIYVLETDQGEEQIAFCMPLWEMFSPYTKAVGTFTDSEQEYLFFTRARSCLPFFELWAERPQWLDSSRFSYPALMNAIWEQFPEYAVAYNAAEQSGRNDIASVFPEIFEDHGSGDRSVRMIAMTEGAGTDFLFL